MLANDSDSATGQSGGRKVAAIKVGAHKGEKEIALLNEAGIKLQPGDRGLREPAR
jgi:hypothetical protein